MAYSTWIRYLRHIYNTTLDKSGASSHAYNGRNTALVFVFYCACWVSYLCQMALPVDVELQPVCGNDICDYKHSKA